MFQATRVAAMQRAGVMQRGVRILRARRHGTAGGALAGWFPLLLGACLAGSAARTCQGGQLVIHTDFAGGSACVLEVDQILRRIRLEPASHPGKGWECWWYLKVSGVDPGEMLEFDVGKAPWATPDRAWFSLDDRNWEPTEAGTREGGRITYRLRVPVSEIWLAWGPPYTLRHVQEGVARCVQRCADAEAFELCRTRADRPVPGLRLSGPEGGFHIWVQARQHAWEAGSSWVCQGFMEWRPSESCTKP